jgi:CheY-like chemotaxis protein
LQKVVSGATVLLVNDAPQEMAYVIELLKDLEIEVVVATDSASALRHAGGRLYDAIISDMARNGVTDEGISFLKELRESGSAVPVIFTVGQYNPQLGTPPFAFGITNRIDECLNLLFDALERVRG